MIFYSPSLANNSYIYYEFKSRLDKKKNIVFFLVDRDR